MRAVYVQMRSCHRCMRYFSGLPIFSREIMIKLNNCKAVPLTESQPAAFSYGCATGYNRAVNGPENRPRP